MSNKTIKINPLFFNNQNKTKKKDKFKKKEINKSNINVNTNKIKSSFIKKIKEYKKNNKTNDNSKKQKSKLLEENDNNDFNESISFIKSVLNDNKIKKEKKNKIQNPIINTNVMDENVMDENVLTNIKKIQQPNNIPLTQNIQQSNTIYNQNIPLQEPLNNINHNTINTPIVPVTQNALPTRQVKNPKTKKVNRKTIKLGKIKNKKIVSILIPSKNDKLRYDNYRRTLKENNINKIKKYLKKRGLIKTGCIAPKNVIREIYESSILTGDIYNNSKDALIHNFMSLD